MTFSTKEHFISAFLTFFATFATTFGATITTIDPTHITQTAIISLVVSAINVSIRATLKEIIK